MEPDANSVTHLTDWTGLGLLEMNEEIEFRRATIDLDSTERRQKRAELIAARAQENPNGASFKCGLDDSVGKEIFWFATGHGPFISYSRRFNASLPPNCRLCGLFDETPDHLLKYCAAFGDLLMDQTTEIGTVETRCKQIVAKLRAL